MRPRPAVWPIVLAIAISLAAVGLLWWVRLRLVAQEERAVEAAVRVFERTGALLTPEDDAIRFATVESLAASIVDGALINGLYVTKNSQARGEVLIVPWALSARNSDWRADLADWEKLPVGGAGAPAGWLYLRLDPSGRRAVDGAIAGFVLLLVGSLTALVLRQRTKERELHSVTLELATSQDQIIGLERLALAGQLSANIFHDIKKPVLNIRHEAQDAMEDGRGDGEILGAIKEQADVFMTLLRDLGIESFASPHSDDAEFCDPRDIAERSLRLVRYEREAVEVDIAEDLTMPPPLILAPPVMLIQVLSNLFLNAFQAMGGQGRVQVTISQTGGMVAFRVADSGPGISSAIAPRIFEPFQTSKGDTGGSGLGLAIGALIAERLGGRLELAAAKGSLGGAEFLLSLPVAEPETGDVREN
ncbi:MAG: ATP-binding protein [Sumerlaeia bacterium]